MLVASRVQLVHTSPLPQEEDILGAMCLIIYSLVFVVFLKYIVFVLEAHRNGEGGTHHHHRHVTILASLVIPYATPHPIR